MTSRLSEERGLWSPVGVLSFACLCCMLAGCDDAARRPSAEELAGFEMAGSSGPSVDWDRLAQAKISPGPYCVTAGDVLHVQVEMPSRAPDGQAAGGASASEGRQSYNCRVNDDGAILLPVVGRVQAAGRPLAEIETAIGTEYYPKYVKMPVPVYVSVLEYSTRRISIVGAVAKPGIYALRREEMSLVGLLMEAGGIVEKGAAMIRITRKDRVDGPPGQIRHSAQPQLERETQHNHGVTARAADMQEPPALDEERYAESRVRVLAIFERDGPLNTTGWLVLQNHSEVLLRRWLDIGTALQRHSLLAGPIVGANKRVREDLDNRLARLAECLGSAGLEQTTPGMIRDAGWENVSAGRFLASLSIPEANRNRFVVDRGYLVGTNLVRTARAGSSGTEDKMLSLPVKGLNIPFADVVLEEGDSVVVEGPDEQFVSVVGLVTRPGNFPYPPTAKYTLIQAIALAGGLDAVADPRYVSVYRLKTDGTIASVTVQLVNPQDKERLTEALALPLRPGDIVSVEHTPRTRTNVFFDRIFRVSLGLYITPDNLWE